jgi:UDP-2-acetamido-3-amino-2,3-dideoxy-glucuronate N-acetyltransferase
MENQKQIAVVGSGFWGKNLVRNYHALGVLRAICDSNPEQLAQFRTACPGVDLVDDFARVLADPEVRAVVIALPAALHHEYARRALLAGKDVYVEKPPAAR